LSPPRSPAELRKRVGKKKKIRWVTPRASTLLHQGGPLPQKQMEQKKHNQARREVTEAQQNNDLAKKALK